MTDLSALLRPDQGQPANALVLLDKKGLEPWLKAQPERVRRAAEAAGFEGKADQFALVPGDKAADWAALVGAADAADPGRGPRLLELEWGAAAHGSANGPRARLGALDGAGQPVSGPV
jgi:hypothetical protein